jgi:peptide/nickel transport system substrate-binding protein
MGRAHRFPGGRPCLPPFFAFRSLLGPLVAVLTAALPACSPSEPPAAADASRIVAAIEATPTNLDPRMATDAYSERIGQLVFSKLVRLGPHQEVRGDLATSWDQPSPTTYVFHLRSGVNFQDGTPLTAKDVAYTFRWILNPAHGSPLRKAYDAIEKITVEDDETVRFDLSAPHAPFLVNMVRGIVPAHLGDSPDYRNHPVGSGPYRLATFRPGEVIELEAFDGYVDGPPPTKHLVFRVLPEDTVRLLAVKKGDVQFVMNALPPDALDVLARDKHLVVERSPGTNYSYLGFNLTDPVLKVRAVREAIARAIDRDAIIATIYRGQARPATGLLPPGHWAYNGDVPTYPYDPGKAKALLDAAGFPDPDGPAPRFTLSYKTSQNELTRRIGEVLQEQLSQVGIGVTVRAYEWGTFYADVKRGNFQLYTLSWVGIADPDIYYDIFHSKSVPPDGFNRGRYANPALDTLLEQGRRTSDPAERKAIYAQVQRIVAHDLPYVSLWHPDAVLVRDRRLQGFSLTPTGDYTSLAQAHMTPG